MSGMSWSWSWLAGLENAVVERFPDCKMTISDRRLAQHLVMILYRLGELHCSRQPNVSILKVDNLLTPPSSRKITHNSQLNRYVNQKRNMCNLSPNIFSIHFCWAASLENDHKFFITLPLKKKKRRREKHSRNVILCHLFQFDTMY